MTFHYVGAMVVIALMALPVAAFVLMASYREHKENRGSKKNHV